MDKYERKVRIEQMESLLKHGEYADALEIADSIDWNTERKIRTLRMVSEVYKINRRYEDAFKTLSIAYERNPDDPIKRKVIYDLCELSIKMNEFAYAIRFLKEFVALSPKDPGRYMLQYKLYKAQEVSYDERIEVLEEFKKNYFGDFREKWAYELAYLYHTCGYSQKCVEACDEIILWFVKGPYVTKAMELKMQHVALSPEQQEKYDRRNDSAKPEVLYEKKHSEKTGPIYSDPADDTAAGGEAFAGIPAPQPKTGPIEIRQVDVSNEPTIKMPEKLRVPEGNDDKQEVSVNLGIDSTIDLQEALRANMAELQKKTGEPLREKEEKIPEPDGGMTEIKSFSEEPLRFPQVEQQASKQNGSDVYAVSKKDNDFKNIISEEYDGQLSLNVPDVPPEIEKQITGQMDIATVLAQWDKLKEESKAKRIDAAKRKSLEQTNDIARELVGVIPGFKIKTLEDENAAETAVPEDEAEKETSEKETADEKDSEAPVNMLQMEEAEGPDEIEEIEEIEETEDRGPVSAVISQAEEKPKPAVSDSSAEAGPEPEVSEKPEDEKEGKENLGPVTDETGRIKIPEPKDMKEFDKDEKEIFASYTSMHGMGDKIVNALKDVSMIASRGNILITGNEQTARIGLAHAFAKQRQLKDPLFSGKIAKISADVFNTKDIERSLKALDGGALLIEKAGELSDASMQAMETVLKTPELILLVIFEDNKGAVRALCKKYPWLSEIFNIYIEIPVYTNDDLVFHAREYAREKEYIIDELGILALYTRIAELQTAEHVVTADEVDDIVDEAIMHVDRKNIGHLVDILFAKRYNNEDLIILREKDFVKK